MPKWWNWQTRCVQGAVGAIPCGFKSRLRHQAKTTIEKSIVFLFHYGKFHLKPTRIWSELRMRLRNLLGWPRAAWWTASDCVGRSFRSSPYIKYGSGTHFSPALSYLFLTPQARVLRTRIRRSRLGQPGKVLPGASGWWRRITGIRAFRWDIRCIRLDLF